MSEFRTLASLGATMEIREGAGDDGRTISGIAVPWNRPTKINAQLTESFAPGAFSAQMRAASRIPLTRGHMRHGGALIGRVTMLRDDQAGLYAEARIAKTSLGDETLELVREGALDGLSIGFVPMRNEAVRGVVVRAAARLTELAVVLDPAYAEAGVTGIRAMADMAVDIGEPEPEADDGDPVEVDVEESRARLAEARAMTLHLSKIYGIGF